MAIGNALTGRAALDTGTAAKQPAGDTYVIAPGDNLAKIAKKFYNSTKNSDVQRIVAANPGVIKDADATLIVGKKIVIPKIAKAALKGGSAGAPASAIVKNAEPVMIYMPGTPASPPAGAGGLGSDMVSDAHSNTGISKVLAPPPPSSSSTSTTTPSSKKNPPKFYVVQAGDTLEKIAKRIAPTNVADTVEKLKSGNGIKDVHNLQVGMKLKLPV
jgi:LysM repeat protein